MSCGNISFHILRVHLSFGGGGTSKIARGRVRVTGGRVIVLEEGRGRFIEVERVQGRGSSKGGSDGEGQWRRVIDG